MQFNHRFIIFLFSLKLWKFTNSFTAYHLPLQIYNGDTATQSNLIASLCGTPNTNGLSYSSQDNMMAIQFHSDGSIADAGFRASYVAWGKCMNYYGQCSL